MFGLSYLDIDLLKLCPVGYVCLSVSPSQVRPCVSCMSVCMPVCLLIHLSVSMSIGQSTCLSVYLPVVISSCLHQPVQLSACLLSRRYRDRKIPSYSPKAFLTEMGPFAIIVSNVVRTIRFIGVNWNYI